jgi:dephospho-CoA kinase
MKVVGVVGMPASGKTEAAEVAREEGVPVVSMGDVIRKEVERRGLEPTDENMGRVGVELRQEEGDDAVARRCADEIRSKDTPVVVVDGVRSADEADLFREEFGDGDNFVLVAVEAPFETRLERVRERGRSDDVDAADELRERDERELGYGMGEAIEEADVTIENDGSLEEFREGFRGVLTRESQ